MTDKKPGLIEAAELCASVHCGHDDVSVCLANISHFLANAKKREALVEAVVRASRSRDDNAYRCGICASVKDALRALDRFDAGEGE